MWRVCRGDPGAREQQQQQQEASARRMLLKEAQPQFSIRFSLLVACAMLSFSFSLLLSLFTVFIFFGSTVVKIIYLRFSDPTSPPPLPSTPLQAKTDHCHQRRLRLVDVVRIASVICPGVRGQLPAACQAMSPLMATPPRGAGATKLLHLDVPPPQPSRLLFCVVKARGSAGVMRRRLDKRCSASFCVWRPLAPSAAA